MPPWFIFALLVSLALALAYQIASRRFGRRLVLYWAVILVGFLAGEILSETVGWDWGRMGDLRLGLDFVGAFLVIIALWFLGL